MARKVCILLSTLMLVSSFALIAKADTAVVSKTADTGIALPCSNCSLREAIATLGDSPFTGQSQIIFSIPPTDPGCNAIVRTCTITLTSGFDIQIASLSSLVTIDGLATVGSGPPYRLIIDGGTGSNRIFTILSSTTIKNLTLQGGNGNSGFSTGSGSAIYMNRFDGSLTLDTVIVQNNDSTGLTNGTAGVTIFGGTGHVIRNSTFANNSGKFCGGLEYQGGVASTLSIVNTTVSFNNAVAQGGGVCLSGQGTTTMRNVTVADNTPPVGGGIIFASGTLNISATIVGHNVATGGLAPDLRFFSGTILTGGGNLIGNNDNSAAVFPVGQPNGPGDWVGDAATPINPRLAPLGLAGGLTPTRPIFTTSLANNNGGSTFGNVQDDQRGALRGGTSDIGAFELNSVPFTAFIPSPIINQPYSQTITANNSGSNYCISNGALPPGLGGVPDCSPPFRKSNLRTAPDAAVIISGTPTSAGSYPFTITVSNGADSYTTDYEIDVLGPTAAHVSVGGRVLTADGRGIRNVLVTITDGNGAARTVFTGTFGHFRFDEVEVGQACVVSASSKRYRFPDGSQVFSVNDEIADVEFRALP